MHFNIFNSIICIYLITINFRDNCRQSKTKLHDEWIHP